MRDLHPRNGPPRPSGGCRVSSTFGVFALSLALGGCGYGFVSTGALPTLAKGRGVAVAGVDNRSTEPDAGLIVARFAGQGLAARGLSAPPGAGLSLYVTIDALDADPVAAGGARSKPPKLPQRVALWRAHGQLSLRVVDTAVEPEKVVATTRVSGSEEYQSGDDIEATEVSRSLAMERLLERLVRDGLDLLK